VAVAVPSDVKTFILTGSGVVEPRRFQPLDEDGPEEILFGCFFHDEDDRAAVLSHLREVASTPVEGLPGSLAIEVAMQMEDCRLRGDVAGLMLATLRWWTGIKRRGYHAYKLRMGVDRYRCSCIIGFRERSATELRDAIEPAIAELEEARERVAGFFQYPFD
jgi:hypothetical protein